MAPGGGGGVTSSGATQGIGAAGQIAYTFLIAPPWLDATPLSRLTPPRQLADLATAIGVVASTPVTTYVSQWDGDRSLPVRLAPLRTLDNPAAPVGVAPSEFLANYISQWGGDRSLPPHLPPPRQLADLAAPIGYGSEFVVSYVSQWGGDRSLPVRLAPPRPLDNPTWPAQIIASTVVTNYLSQWIGQSDIAHLPPNRRIDDLAAPLGYAGEFTPSFVAQWLGQSDVLHLPPPRQIDNALSLHTIVPPTATPSIFWMEESGLARWTLLKPPSMWDQSAAYIVPIFPPPPVILHSRCIYSLGSNFTRLRPQTYGQRYVRANEILTWSASFYLNNLIVLTPISATLTINYQTNTSHETLALPMTSPDGYLWSASWTVDPLAGDISQATWSITETMLNVLVNGQFIIFNHYSSPIRDP